MHTLIALETARAVEAEIRRRSNRPDRRLVDELHRERRSRHTRRSR